MSLESTNKIETNKYELEISVDADKFDSAVNKVYKKNIKKINVPGFRRGKAPRSIVEKLYGENVFYEDAVNALYPEEYETAVKEAKLEPVDRADVEVVKVGKEGLVFKAKVTVKPEVELSEYKGLAVTKKPVAVTDEEVSAELSRLQQRNARMLTVEDRPAQKGDIAVIDYEGFVDGKAFEGGKAEKQSLELGSGQFIPGFEDQVAGHSVNEEFEINVKFPDDYSAENLKGKEATFKIKLDELKMKELPEIDDEFAKDVSELDTLDALKEDIKKKLLEQKQHQSDEDVENQLVDKVIEGMKAEVPEVMFEHAVDNMVNDFDYRLQAQGMNINGYLQYSGMKMEDFRKTFRPQAERRVKIRLALEKIAQMENLEASAEDLEKEYAKIAEQYHVGADKVKNAFAKEDLANDIKTNKAIDLVKKQAVITEEAAEAPEKSENESGKAAGEKKAEPKKTRKPAKKVQEEEKTEA